ncbi:MAG: M23 family metallopeptidase, partial [Clostridia bacterium]|nr:M23 family metallopeptidase [Clostridia bacterium]
PAPTPTPPASATPTPAPAAANAAVKKGIAPVEGSIVWDFSMDQLLYSRTLDQWTTHAGVDIAAEQGAEVRAVLAGTVEEVYEDDALGWTVTVTHTNGRKSLYANLDPAVAVTAGQKLNAGDAVGKVGSSATAECGEVSHLHFGFFVDNQAVDPAGHVAIQR